MLPRLEEVSTVAFNFNVTLIDYHSTIWDILSNLEPSEATESGALTPAASSAEVALVSHDSSD